MGYIYVIENQVNNKKYVGQTIDPVERWRKHKTDDIHNNNLVIGKAFLKYGIENFTFSIMEECEDSKMSEREMYWINKLNTFIKSPNSNGYNMTRGGEAMFGDSNPFYGRTHSDTTKQLLSAYAKTRIGNKNPFYGRKHSEEFRNRRRGSLFFGPNTVKCIAKNDDAEICFDSIRAAYEIFKGQVSYDWFRKSVRKAIKLGTKFLDYYWYKSVETIGDECNQVGSEISTDSKCATSINIEEEIVQTTRNS